jgi:hypothetical protein
MVAAASRRRPAAKKSSRQAKGFAKKAVLWSVLSAVGGAVLLFLGQVAIEEYKGGRAAETKAEETRGQRQEHQAERLDTLFDEYLALGSAVDRASAYIDTGKGGSKDDVALVTRHFRKLVSYGVAGRLELSGILQLYGGRLIFWRDQLVRLGSGKSPASHDFAEGELQTFQRLGESLRALSMPPSAIADRTLAVLAPAHVEPNPRPDVAPGPMAVDRGSQVADSPQTPEEMEAFRQELIKQARAQGIEIPESTLDQLVSGHIVAAAAGGPESLIPEPGIQMSTEKPPASALDRIVGNQAEAKSKDAAAPPVQPSTPEGQ